MCSPIPRAADSSMLDGDITWEEVYRVTWPLCPQMLPHLRPCHASCSLCREAIEQLGEHAVDSSVPLPIWRPHLHTSVAAGPNGLSAELLRWGRGWTTRRPTSTFAVDWPPGWLPA